MALIRVDWRLHHANGIPADDVLNTFHFSTASEDPDVYGPDVVDAIREFYDDDVPSPPAQFSRISEMLSTELSGDWTATIRDANLAPPNPPLYVETGSFAGVGDIGLPAEVAIVLSYRGTLVDPLFPGRYRGRLFIGSLQTGTAESDANNIRRPRADAQTVLTRAGDRLRVTSTGFGAGWGVYSRANVPATLTPVVSVSVDNAFDTVRSRGPKPTSRVTLPA